MGSSGVDVDVVVGPDGNVVGTGNGIVVVTGSEPIGPGSAVVEGPPPPGGAVVGDDDGGPEGDAPPPFGPPPTPPPPRPAPAGPTPLPVAPPPVVEKAEANRFGARPMAWSRSLLRGPASVTLWSSATRPQFDAP